MKNKSSYSPVEVLPAISWRALSALLCALLCTLAVPPRAASGRRARMDACRGAAPLPPHDEKTDAVLLYSEQIVNVQSADRIKTRVRMVFKISDRVDAINGMAAVPFNAHRKINGFAAGVFQPKGKTMR